MLLRKFVIGKATAGLRNRLQKGRAVMTLISAPNDRLVPAVSPRVLIRERSHPPS